jgi:hypothetical protein
MLISTERLTLRRFNEGALIALHRIWTDLATICWGALASIDESRVLLARAIAQEWYE